MADFISDIRIEILFILTRDYQRRNKSYTAHTN
nr:MAG TPA: hypothetical protein [Caudoviricetes sp.]